MGATISSAEGECSQWEMQLALSSILVKNENADRGGLPYVPRSPMGKENG